MSMGLVCLYLLYINTPILFLGPFLEPYELLYYIIYLDYLSIIVTCTVYIYCHTKFYLYIEYTIVYSYFKVIVLPLLF